MCRKNYIEIKNFLFIIKLNTINNKGNKTMSGNELPSNMGKKIADALKKQSKTAVKENTADVVEETKKVSDDTFEEEISRLHNDTTETDIDTEAESFVKEPDFSVAPELDEEEKESAYDDLDMYDTPSLEVEQ